MESFGRSLRPAGRPGSAYASPVARGREQVAAPGPVASRKV